MKAGLTLAVVLLSVAACTDEQDATPTSPPATVSAQTAPAPAPMSGATVCLSYGRDREIVRGELRDALRDAPKSEALQKKLKALDELILDAC